MLISTRDFPTDPAPVFAGQHAAEWNEIKRALQAVPVHLKASDQAGIQGNPIFDPVGTNSAISAALGRHGWRLIALPAQYALGIGLDFAKNGVIVEVQFSNYPFLINNVFRADFLYSQGVRIDHLGTTEALVIITKGVMFPASNSTLYYEQAVNTLTRHFPFTIPTRIVGLQERRGRAVQVHFTEYAAARYSRVVALQSPRAVRFIGEAGRRCRVEAR